MKRPLYIAVFLAIISLLQPGCKPGPKADLILVNGKIVTVDNKFSVAEAVAVSDGKILAVGTNRTITKYAGDSTKVIDLKGKTVIPGLIESHVHPDGASTSELDSKFPDVHTIKQVLSWIKSEADSKPKGQWIVYPKLFFTRLAELRQPTLAELDSVAPEHPVFLNGSFGGAINTAAMKVSGIPENTTHPGILRDEKTGKLTGFIRSSAFGLLKIPPSRELTVAERYDALHNMLNRYNRYAITSIFSASGDYGTVKMYRAMKEKGLLTTRVYQNILIRPDRGVTKDQMNEILKPLTEKTGDGDEWVRIGSLKIFIDGGILTGTAYLSEPWGAKAQRLFSIENPGYKGILNYSREELLNIVGAANEHDWSFTVHATGGGAVELMLDVYNEVNKSKPIGEKRFSIIHGNFFSPKAIEMMKKLNVYGNVQAAWFYKDADAMQEILGNERMKDFHPYKTMIKKGIMLNAGSDHMVKFDANESINPYNPFLAMWAAITRTTERGSVIGLDEAISREEALKMYTINNAYASFEEGIKGSIEPGKYADMAVISADILNCQTEEIRNIESLVTMVGGKVVYNSGAIKF
jgi:predicted amidohydrolase YtcJ